jgi:hypothetical protein
MPRNWWLPTLTVGALFAVFVGALQLGMPPGTLVVGALSVVGGLLLGAWLASRD